MRILILSLYLNWFLLEHSFHLGKKDQYGSAQLDFSVSLQKAKLKKACNHTHINFRPWSDFITATIKVNPLHQNLMFKPLFPVSNFENARYYQICSCLIHCYPTWSNTACKNVWGINGVFEKSCATSLILITYLPQLQYEPVERVKE